MSYDNFIPTVVEQIFRNGDACTGVTYTGTEVAREFDDSSLDGHLHRSSPADGQPAIDGGLIDLGILRPRCYSKLVSAFIYLPGATAITMYVVTDLGHEIAIAAVSAATLVSSALDSWDLLPGYKIKIVATGGVTGSGIVSIHINDWAYPAQQW